MSLLWTMSPTRKVLNLIFDNEFFFVSNELLYLDSKSSLG
jgi:hypothetical protein